MNDHGFTGSAWEIAGKCAAVTLLVVPMGFGLWVLFCEWCSDVRKWKEAKGLAKERDEYKAKAEALDTMLGMANAEIERLKTAGPYRGAT